MFALPAQDHFIYDGRGKNSDEMGPRKSKLPLVSLKLKNLNKETLWEPFEETPLETKSQSMHDSGKGSPGQATNVKFGNSLRFFSFDI